MPSLNRLSIIRGGRQARPLARADSNIQVVVYGRVTARVNDADAADLAPVDFAGDGQREIAAKTQRAASDAVTLRAAKLALAIGAGMAQSYSFIDIAISSLLVLVKQSKCC
jgi:hypothetical protein